MAKWFRTIAETYQSLKGVLRLVAGGIAISLFHEAWTMSDHGEYLGALVMVAVAVVLSLIAVWGWSGFSEHPRLTKPLKWILRIVAVCWGAISFSVIWRNRGSKPWSNFTFQDFITARSFVSILMMISWRWLAVIVGIVSAFLIGRWTRPQGEAEKGIVRSDTLRSCQDEWLHDKLKVDKASIKNLVRVCAIRYSAPDNRTTERLQDYVEFTLHIFNLSLYDIVFPDSLSGGYLTFGVAGEGFTRDCKLTPKNAIGCHARNPCALTIRQYLDPVETKKIPEMAFFWFKTLGLTFRRVGSSLDDLPVPLNTDYCLETKRGRWHINDYPEYAFALNEEQWADLTRGDLITKRVEIHALQLERNALKSELENSIKVPIHGQLVIEMATYGAGDDIEPVTSILQSKVRDGQLRIKEKYNTLFRVNPAHNVHKRLDVTYLHDGHRFFITVEEDTKFVLPMPYETG
jgi:uncharacterized membrane protein YiaA